MSVVQAGNVVHVHYTGKFESGDVFDTSEGGDPLEFTAGSPEVIVGVSNGVLGMAVGESKTITVTPEDGYGDYEDGLTQSVPRGVLPPEVKVGDQIVAANDPDSAFWVRELTDEEAVIDANHRLAGETLTFELELVSIQEV
jgi:peptidylprolyl isomerase